VNSAPEVGGAIAGFEPLLQAPARLQVMAVLAHAQDAEFARLKEVTGTSDSVMSKHLAALSDAGLIKLRKAAVDGRQRTWARLTREGRHRFDEHVAALQRIVAGG
jgi:DNA-binding MarR family transcriptional regulator